MEIRDIEQVHALDQLSFSLPWPERSFRYEVTQNKNAILWVAETEPAPARPDLGVTMADESALAGAPAQVVGMIVVWFIVDEAHIGTIAVHPDYRRHGIGRQLLIRALLDAQARGGQTAFLEVRRSNLGAQALYQQFGFVEVGVRPRYYQDNREDALLLTLDVVDPVFLNSLALMEVDE